MCGWAERKEGRKWKARRGSEHSDGWKLCWCWKEGYEEGRQNVGSVRGSGWAVTQVW